MFALLCVLWKLKKDPSVSPRETREGWPLLTVETGVNGDSKSTNERGPSFWLVRWAFRAGTRDAWSASAALVGPVRNM